VPEPRIQLKMGTYQGPVFCNSGFPFSAGEDVTTTLQFSPGDDPYNTVRMDMTAESSNGFGSPCIWRHTSLCSVSNGPSCSEGQEPWVCQVKAYGQWDSCMFVTPAKGQQVQLCYADQVVYPVQHTPTCQGATRGPLRLQG
jgi:hypothetical protein